MIDKVEFSIDIAKIIGADSAIIFNYFLSQVPENEDNGASNEPFYFDGYHWTNISTELLHNLFPFFTYKQMDEALDELRNEGFITTGDYDEVAGFGDRKSNNHAESKYGERLWFRITKSGKNLEKAIEEANAKNYRLGLVMEHGNDGWEIPIEGKASIMREFHTKLAEIVGVNSAVIFSEFCMCNSEDFCFDGHYWNPVYIDMVQYLTSFTHKQIHEAMKKLTDEGLMATGDYNEAANNMSGYEKFKQDRMIWFRTTEKGKSIAEELGIIEPEEEIESDLPF